MVISPITIIPYARRFRRDLMRMLQYEHLLHVDLDWDAVEEWINYPDVPMYLGWSEDRLVGVIAASPPLNHTSWLRLAVIDNEAGIDDTLAALWPHLRNKLLDLGVTADRALIMQSSLAPHLPLHCPYNREDNVNLRRQRM